MSYVSEPCPCSKKHIKVKFGFSNYAKKSDLKTVTAVDTSEFLKTYDLASLISDI